MNKERYHQIIDEVYNKYKTHIQRQRDIQKRMVQRLRSEGKKVRVALIVLLTKEEFINKCKTDQEFSEKLGLKIEERELGLKTRLLLLFKELSNEVKLTMGKDGPKFDVGFDPSKYTTHEDCDKNNIPTKLIILEYNGEKIEVYE
jgi:hypothetical protein